MNQGSDKIKDAGDHADLTQADADQLIREMKTAAERLFFMPEPGEENKEFNVIGDETGRKFIISVFRFKKNPKRHQIAARTDDNIMLMRLCVLPAHPHKNPDKTIIRGSHWHIYREGHDCAVAIPANIESPNFIDDTLRLLKKFHVIKKPKLKYPVKQGQLDI